MPGVDGVAATAEICRRTPAKVLVLTMYDVDEHVYDALRAGASGFLLKDVRRDDLARAVRLVAAGEPPKGVGAVHTIELPFVFGTLRFTGIPGGAEALRTDRARLTRLSDQVIAAWTSFARSGVPSRSWPAYRAPRRTTMIWDLSPRTADDPRGEERALWDGYPFGPIAR